MLSKIPKASKGEQREHSEQRLRGRKFSEKDVQPCALVQCSVWVIMGMGGVSNGWRHG